MLDAICHPATKIVGNAEGRQRLGWADSAGWKCRSFYMKGAATALQMRLETGFYCSGRTLETEPGNRNL